MCSDAQPLLYENFASSIRVSYARVVNQSLCHLVNAFRRHSPCRSDQITFWRNIRMRRLILIGTTALMLLMAPKTHAQERMSQNQMDRLLARTEARARQARLNFNRLIANYPGFL